MRLLFFGLLTILQLLVKIVRTQGLESFEIFPVNFATSVPVEFTGVSWSRSRRLLVGAGYSGGPIATKVRLFIGFDITTVQQTVSDLDLTDKLAYIDAAERIAFVSSGKLVMVPWIWNPDLISGSFSSEVSSSSPFSSVLEYLDFNRTDTDWFLAANSLSLIRVDPSTFMLSGTFTTLPNPLGGGAPPLRMRMYQSDFVLAQSTSIGLQGHCLFRFTDSTPSMYTKITSALRQSLARTDLGMFVTMRGSRRVFDLSPLSATTSGLASVDVELDEVVQWSPSGVINDRFLAFEHISNTGYLMSINAETTQLLSKLYFFSSVSLTLIFSGPSIGSDNLALSPSLAWHKITADYDYDFSISNPRDPDYFNGVYPNIDGTILTLPTRINCPIPNCKRCSVEYATNFCELCKLDGFDSLSSFQFLFLNEQAIPNQCIFQSELPPRTGIDLSSVDVPRVLTCVDPLCQDCSADFTQCAVCQGGSDLLAGLGACTPAGRIGLASTSFDPVLMLVRYTFNQVLSPSSVNLESFSFLLTNTATSFRRECSPSLCAITIENNNTLVVHLRSVLEGMEWSGDFTLDRPSTSHFHIYSEDMQSVFLSYPVLLPIRVTQPLLHTSDPDTKAFLQSTSTVLSAVSQVSRAVSLLTLPLQGPSLAISLDRFISEFWHLALLSSPLMEYPQAVIKEMNSGNMIPVDGDKISGGIGWITEDGCRTDEVMDRNGLKCTIFTNFIIELLELFIIFIISTIITLVTKFFPKYKNILKNSGYRMTMAKIEGMALEIMIMLSINMFYTGPSTTPYGLFTIILSWLLFCTLTISLGWILIRIGIKYRKGDRVLNRVENACAGGFEEIENGGDGSGEGKESSGGRVKASFVNVYLPSVNFVRSSLLAIFLIALIPSPLAQSITLLSLQMVYTLLTLSLSSLSTPSLPSIILTNIPNTLILIYLLISTIAILLQSSLSPDTINRTIGFVLSLVLIIMILFNVGVAVWQIIKAAIAGVKYLYRKVFNKGGKQRIISNESSLCKVHPSGQIPSVQQLDGANCLLENQNGNGVGSQSLSKLDRKVSTPPTHDSGDTAFQTSSQLLTPGRTRIPRRTLNRRVTITNKQ